MIQRAEQFSPNSVEKDLAILQAVADRLRAKGCGLTVLREDHLAGSSGQWDVILTMGRLPETLAWLQKQSARIVNTPEGVAHCGRCHLQEVMAQLGTPVPLDEGTDGYWLKRGDAAAQSQGDVVFAPDRQSLEKAIGHMRDLGINSYTVSAHVVGDLVKFYGVRGTGFFRCYYPTDDGQTKFDDERRNGVARHYVFDAVHLQQEAERLAQAVGIEVYGGDCIVRADGSFCLIDFNDWPSFSRCREEAADAIVKLIE